MRRTLPALLLALLAAACGGGDPSFAEAAAEACTEEGAIPESGFPVDTAAMAQSLRDLGSALEARADAVAALSPDPDEQEPADAAVAAWRAMAGHLGRAADAAEAWDRAGALDQLDAYKERRAEADAAVEALGLDACTVQSSLVPA